MNRIRIIGGKFRSRLLILPPLNIDIRPTQDRVREAIFSAISKEIENKVCLDLFAGSGAMGFEAYSRGAKYIYFNDSNRKCVDAIKKSATDLDITNNIKVYNLDYLKALNLFKDTNIKFDLVFLDPPYKLNVNNKIIEYLIKFDLLNKNSIVICEQEDEITEIEGFNLKKYKYSYKRVGIYRKENL